MLNSIFKKYDIRGGYPNDLNEELAKKIASAYFHLLKPETVCVAYDPIEGSKEVCLAFLEKLVYFGVNVVNFGMCSTPMLYFGSIHLKHIHALMFTSSHLGEGYTGIKFLKNGLPLTEDELASISILYEQEEKEVLNIGKGSIETVSITLDYIKSIRSFFSGDLSKYKVVFDASNGPNSLLIDQIFANTGLEYSTINSEIRSKGLSHPSNPKISANRSQLVESVKEHGSDLGVVWDGDCDRAYFLDGLGETICPEFVAIEIAKYIKKLQGYTKITVDVRASKAVEDICREEGIDVKRIQAWHVPIKLEMEKDSSIGFGCETSGHYVFRDFYRIDDGLLASALFLSALNSQNSDLVELLKSFREKYYIIEEINFVLNESEAEVTKKLSERYFLGELDYTDGLSVTFPTWRFNIRSSKTESILRLNISGVNKNEVDTNLEIISGIVRS